MTDYPPEPWDLRGQLHSSAFLVPLADVPVDLPPGCRPCASAVAASSARPGSPTSPAGC